jgi:hypothetical protein
MTPCRPQLKERPSRRLERPHERATAPGRRLERPHERATVADLRRPRPTTYSAWETLRHGAPGNLTGPYRQFELASRHQEHTGTHNPLTRPREESVFVQIHLSMRSIYTPPESGKRRASYVSLPLLSHLFIHAIYSPVPCSLLAPSAAFPTPKRFRVAYMKPMDVTESSYLR